MWNGFDRPKLLGEFPPGGTGVRCGRGRAVDEPLPAGMLMSLLLAEYLMPRRYQISFNDKFATRTTLQSQTWTPRFVVERFGNQRCIVLNH